jgi:hypothetical protein
MKSIPWIDESNMTPAQVEESRWRRLEQAKAKKRMKHDKNLPADCHGCLVGARWTKPETISLIQELIAQTKGKKRTEVLLADFCRKFNRTDNGILYRLRLLGLLIRKEGEFSYKPLQHMSRKNSEALAFKFPEVVEILLSNGWRKDHLNRFVSPVWFTMIHFSRKGMSEGKELDW